jgi:hypothetical protein
VFNAAADRDSEDVQVAGTEECYGRQTQDRFRAPASTAESREFGKHRGPTSGSRGSVWGFGDPTRIDGIG